MLTGLKVLAVIPARLNSTRLPNKPLIQINKKPLIYYTYRNLNSPLIDKKIVATDSKKIIQAIKEFNGEVMMTKPYHKNGTERVAEVAKKFPEYKIILNIQGDEPQINSTMVKKLLQPFSNNAEVVMTTLKVNINPFQAKNPNLVKIITNRKKKAIYFSRSLIPFYQNKKEKLVFYKHLGVYGFCRDYLLKYIKLPPSPLEKKESLEQLRVIENGDHIHVEEIKKDLIDINTPADIRRFKKLF